MAALAEATVNSIRLEQGQMEAVAEQTAMVVEAKGTVEGQEELVEEMELAAATEEAAMVAVVAD